MIFKSKVTSLLLIISIATSCKSQNKSSIREDDEAITNSLILEETYSQIGDYIIEVFEDSKGNLWFGTIAKGVAMYDGSQLKYVTTDDGLGGNRVQAIVEDKDGNLWFGTHSGICKYNGQSFKVYTEQVGLCDNRVSNLLIDSKGIFWIGTWGGVCKFDGNNFQDFPLPLPDIESPYNQTTKNWLTEIKEDSKGNIWFGRDGYGACKYDGNTFTHFTKADGLSANTVREIVEDKDGNIWFGSRVAEKSYPGFTPQSGSGGLDKYHNKTFTKFPDIEGLYNNDVYEIYRDSKDNIWIGTMDKGLYKYDGKQFVNYSGIYPSSDFPKPVTNILEDSKGQIWIGCAGGLFRLTSAGVINVTRNGPWH